MIGLALREVREERGWARRVIAHMLHVSESLVNEWEHGRRRISEAMKPVLARKLNSGKLCMALKREATGGVMAAPYLDGQNIDNHRLVCAEKTIEEMQEAIAALEAMKPILRLPPDRIPAETRREIAEKLLEIVEADTAAENTLARMPGEYNISLAELYDRHQAELIEKGFLEKEKPLKKAVM